VEPTRPGARRRFLRSLTAIALVAMAIALVALDRWVVEGFRDERWRHPVRVYAAPTVLRPGLDVDAFGFERELAARGYRAVERGELEPGTWRRTTASLDVFVRAAPCATCSEPRPAERIRLELDGPRVRAIQRLATGERIAETALEPSLLEGELREHWTARRPLHLDDVPAAVVEAVLLAEDARFWEHPGVDLGALLRAFRINWAAGELRQGGSTITQQLVKNAYLTPERTVGRKLVEIPMTISLERHFSKREILEAYLATVYLGHDRLVGIYGLAEGARVYLGKDVSELTVGEGALLGGLIRAPNVYSPLRHPERALARRDQVIAHLRRLGRLDAEAAARARAEALPHPAPRAAAPESFFVQQARREIEEAAPLAELDPGSAVFTTLDARLQRIVADEVRARRSEPAEVAVIALDPRTGAIRALVGGRDYLASQLDRATRARRSLDAMIEPFVVLAAADPAAATGRLAAGGDPGLRPVAWNVSPPRTAVGWKALADRLSFTSHPDPAGSGEARDLTASLLELVSAYALLAAEGRGAAHAAVLAVQDSSGALRPTRAFPPPPAIDETSARAIHARLGAESRRGPMDFAALGATGRIAATDGHRDVWVVGYSRDLALGVWTGFDDERPLDLGAEARAGALWSAIFSRARAGLPEESEPSSGGVLAASPEDAPRTGPVAGLLARGTSR
jgi:penicillin-binding protein 1B